MADPILRWPGGKRTLLPEIKKYLPETFKCLHEPFAGGGALSFSLGCTGAYLSDLNAELINFYTVLKQKPFLLAAQLLRFDLTRETYYALRGADRLSGFKHFDPVWRAARYLFINRTCFNGVMRVNKLDQLNASHGAPLIAERIYNTEDIWQAHEALRGARIYHAPYSLLENVVQSGDFVYFDPPYVPVRPAGDINYTPQSFTLNDQGQLALLCGRLTKMGIKWMLSNANVDFIHKLYGHYKIHELSARRSLSGNAAFRGFAQEVLVTNYT